MELVIFDFNRTLYDPDTKSLIDGAENLLSELYNKGYNLALLSKDNPERKALVESLGIAHYFSSIQYVDKKDDASIAKLIKKYDVSSAETIVVGDSHKSELLAGSNLGTTVIAVAGGLCNLEDAQKLGVAYCQNLNQVLNLITS